MLPGFLNCYNLYSGIKKNRENINNSSESESSRMILRVVNDLLCY